MTKQFTTAFVAVCALSAVLEADTAPPFFGTVWISPDIITSADRSGLTGVTYTGRGERTLWDYRVLDWITVEAYLFEARIHGRGVEFQVNPEFGSEDAARIEVDTYAPAIGRMPFGMLARLENVHVNAGNPDHPDAASFGRQGRRDPQVFGGSYEARSIILHTGYGQERIRDGFLEEVLFHEAAHVGFQNHQNAPGRRAARDADEGFISNYARDNPDREDVAETMLVYFAIRYRPDRLSASQRVAIRETVPNRVEYFDGLALDWSRYIGRQGSLADGVKDLVDEGLDALNDDSNGRQAAESVPAMPAAGVLLLAILLGLLGQRRIRVG